MNQDYVSLETAKLLKEVGYDNNHKMRLYNGEEYVLKGVDIPLWNAQKFLREKYNVFANVLPLIDSRTNLATSFEATINNAIFSKKRYATCELALDAGIAKACEIIKEKK